MRNLLLLVAVACIGVGIYLGDVRLVMNKAVHICLECIGIG